jgi:hypothetical protein
VAGQQVSPVGQYLTITSGPDAHSEAYVFVEERGSAMAVAPMLPDRAMPAVGELVSCVSGVGWFQTTVRRVEGQVVVLTVPAWARRGIKRNALRVPISTTVHLDNGSEVWAGRLVDVSVTGGAILTEARAELDPGAQVTVELPAGAADAVVRSVRAHEHALLVTVGVSWGSLTPAARAWVSDHVSSARNRPNPGDGAPGH